MCRIPQLNGAAVIDASQDTAIGTERHRDNKRAAGYNLGARPQVLEIAYIPQLDYARTGDGEGAAVRAECDRANAALVRTGKGTAERLWICRGSDIPQLDRTGTGLAADLKSSYGTAIRTVYEGVDWLVFGGLK